MSSGCSDVCEEVMVMLQQVGFRFVMDSDDHDDILEALGHVHLIRDDEDKPSLQRGKPWKPGFEYSEPPKRSANPPIPPIQPRKSS